MPCIVLYKNCIQISKIIFQTDKSNDERLEEFGQFKNVEAKNISINPFYYADGNSTGVRHMYY